MPSYLPPKKRICLDLNHYSIPCATEDKIDQSTLSLTTIRESLPNLTVQQNPKRSIAVEKIQGPLNYFYLFRWLPQELQLLIWETATAEIEAQIITISSETKRPQPSQHVTQHRPSRAYVHSETIFLTAQYTIPNILHACGNARDMALKYYRPVFARELGGAPIYMAIGARRTPDTFLFKSLTALQMLRSRTQNFRIVRNDMDRITSAIVCTDIDRQPYRNPQNLRWVTSSLRALDVLWIAELEPWTCPRHARARPNVLRFLRYILADIMISQHATLKQMQGLAGYGMQAEALKCVHDPKYCWKKWGFRVPETKPTSVRQLRDIAGRGVGRREQSHVTLEYLQKILKDRSAV